MLDNAAWNIIFNTQQQYMNMILNSIDLLVMQVMWRLQGQKSLADHQLQMRSKETSKV